MKSKENNINGLFVYRDNRNNTIYHDLYSNKDFTIPVEAYDKYTFYSLRAIIAIAVIFVLKNMLKFPFYSSVLIGACIYLLLSMLFRYGFLWKFKENLYFLNHKRDDLFSKTAKEYAVWQLFLLAFIIMVVLASLIFQTYQAGYSGRDLIAAYVLIAIAAVFAVFYLIALAVKLIRKY